MTQPTMNSIDVEVIFLGDAPGQADTIKLGKTVYERGKTYRNVPLEHFRRGGFYAFEQWDGIPILLGSPSGGALCWVQHRPCGTTSTQHAGC